MKLFEILRENQQKKNLMARKRAKRWGVMYEGDFDCSHEELTSLRGAPPIVIGDFYCNGNQLTSLEGAPTNVDGSFYCNDNKLTSLEGAPTKVGTNFHCHNNPIKSLAGIGTYFKDGHIMGNLQLPDSIESHLLGILLIPRLMEIWIHSDWINATKPGQAASIINKHLRKDRDILECQEELRSAGLREFGKL